MYAPASTVSPLRADRAWSVIHSPHSGVLGQPSTSSYVPRGGPAPDEPAAKEESNTVLYVGIGLGVLAVGGLVVYLATRKKGRRR